MLNYFIQAFMKRLYEGCKAV